MYGHQEGKVVGEVGGVMNWETGIDIYTLICIKWITNKNLLYKKINKIKFKNSKKKNKRYMYPNVHGNTIYNNQDMEATYVSIDR